MNLGAALKQISKIIDKDNIFCNVLSDFFIQFHQEMTYDKKDRSKVIAVNLSDDLTDDYIYFQHKNSKEKLGFYQYREKCYNFSKTNTQEKTKLLEENYIKIYDTKCYEKSIVEAQNLVTQYKKMGLKAKVVYDKNYKKASVENQPDDIWIEFTL